jgi:heterodisulfide reductase subunit C
VGRKSSGNCRKGRTEKKLRLTINEVKVEKIESKNLDSHFKYDVAAQPGGENIKLCFACGTCTAGCPVAGVDDEFNPRKIIRQVLLGMRKEVLSSPVIWRCVQCYSCSAKCPQNVKFRDVMKALREMAVKEGYVKPELLEEVEQLDEFSQKLRRDLVNVLVTDPEKFKNLKKKVQETTTAEC